MQSFRYFGEQVESFKNLEVTSIIVLKTNIIALNCCLKNCFSRQTRMIVFQQPVKQMEKNIKLGKVLLMTTAQHLAHALQEIELHALVYVHQHQSSVRKERKKSNIKSISLAVNAFVTENVVLKVTALQFCQFFFFPGSIEMLKD